MKKLTAKERKAIPVYSGVLAYFPNAILEVTQASIVGNEQHLKGQPLHYDENKSQDHLDALTRHLLDHAKGEIFDDDGVRHITKVCWRSLAFLQHELEKEK